MPVSTHAGARYHRPSTQPLYVFYNMMKTNKLLTILLLLSAAWLFSSSRRHTKIFIIGDSTAAEKKDVAINPERGWGMMLQGFFDEQVIVDNHAVNGRSSKSFLDEGRWQRVLERIRPGDYVLIQFGHNDEKPDLARHTVPGSTFDANLARYVSDTRAKGGIPVLLNSVARRNFYHQVDSTADDELLRNTAYSDEPVNSDTLVDTHGAYRKVPGEVAAKTGTLFIDANKITHELEQGLGVTGSRRLHVWLQPGQWPGVPQGRRDNTHYNAYGARTVAGLIAAEIGRKIPSLRRHLKTYEYVVSGQGRGNFMNMNDLIAEVPAGRRTKVYVLDGHWNIAQAKIQGKKIRFVCFPGASVKVE